MLTFGANDGPEILDPAHLNPCQYSQILGRQRPPVCAKDPVHHRSLFGQILHRNPIDAGLPAFCRTRFDVGYS